VAAEQIHARRAHARPTTSLTNSRLRHPQVKSPPPPRTIPALARPSASASERLRRPPRPRAGRTHRLHTNRSSSFRGAYPPDPLRETNVIVVPRNRSGRRRAGHAGRWPSTASVSSCSSLRSAAAAAAQPPASAVVVVAARAGLRPALRQQPFPAGSAVRPPATRRRHRAAGPFGPLACRGASLPRHAGRPRHSLRSETLIRHESRPVSSRCARTKEGSTSAGPSRPGHARGRVQPRHPCSLYGGPSMALRRPGSGRPDHGFR